MSNKESQIRANELDNIAINNNTNKQNIVYGFDKDFQEKCKKRKQRILEYFNSTTENWDKYSWQIANRISDIKTLNKIFPLNKNYYDEIETISQNYRWSISPYYLSLVDTNNMFDEIGLMSLPNILEEDSSGDKDPMNEEFTNPAGTITRRYPDRLIINVTNMCGMYCRFCQRKRNIGETDCHNSKEKIQESIDYIKKTPTIRDVLITGGDSLTLSNKALEDIIKQLRTIEHVEIIRLGSRLPVTIPQRIDDDLVNMLKKYHPIYLNTHFNHPKEVTPESKTACEKLANAGIPLGNQMVLLNGINNNKYTILKLNHELLKIRVKPYYIFHPKHVKGTSHFYCSIRQGLDIMEFLRGNTSGMANPAYILNATGGLGKTPLLKPRYKFLEDGTIELRTWENKKVIYHDNDTIDMKTLYENFTE